MKSTGMQTVCFGADNASSTPGWETHTQGHVGSRVRSMCGVGNKQIATRAMPTLLCTLSGSGPSMACPGHFELSTVHFRQAPKFCFPQFRLPAKSARMFKHAIICTFLLRPYCRGRSSRVRIFCAVQLPLACLAAARRGRAPSITRRGGPPSLIQV